MREFTHGYRAWLITIIGLVVMLWGMPVTRAENETVQNANGNCLICHKNAIPTTPGNDALKPPAFDLETYNTSVHGKNTCTTCHAQQTKVPHDVSAAGTNKTSQLNENCAACHAEVAGKWRQSVHAEKGTAGCTSCHRVHSSKEEQFPRLLTGKTTEAVCTSCHAGEVMASYKESFHGKATSLGSTKAPTCASCHGEHNILGPGDPNSPVASVNIPTTCAKCHQGATENLAVGREHFSIQPTGPGAPMYFTYKFFTWLTIATITLLIIHIELELYRKYMTSRLS